MLAIRMGKLLLSRPYLLYAREKAPSTILSRTEALRRASQETLPVKRILASTAAIRRV